MKLEVESKFDVDDWVLYNGYIIKIKGIAYKGDHFDYSFACPWNTGSMNVPESLLHAVVVTIL